MIQRTTYIYGLQRATTATFATNIRPTIVCVADVAVVATQVTCRVDTIGVPASLL